ncbi:MAG: YhcH/YjgK/YiaL family protein [Prevotella sp.]|nr:YhcH/YjgK/YiaL family protein [Prevotella sp.]
MKRLITICMVLIATTITSMAQTTYYTKVSTDKQLNKKAAKWIKSGEWRNGFDKASPDKSVNIVEMYEQYQKNPKQWEAMFQWLATTDLFAIPKGKHPIPGTDLVASVEDSKNEPLAKRKSESHYHHIDFQYVVKGKERFAILDHMSSKPNCEYRPDVIHYDYDIAKTRFIDSRTDRFFLFFPCDWHIAKVATEDEDQTIRVIVVKLDYVE